MNEKNVELLKAMGFEKKKCYEALNRTNGDVERALNYLLNNNSNNRSLDYKRVEGPNRLNKNSNKWSLDCKIVEGPISQYSIENGRSACTCICLKAAEELLGTDDVLRVTEMITSSFLQKIIIEGVEIYKKLQTNNSTTVEHFSAEEILNLGFFVHCLDWTGGVVQGLLSRDPQLGFGRLLNASQQGEEWVAVLITKTPETVLVILPPKDWDIPGHNFVLIDSHPRRQGQFQADQAYARFHPNLRALVQSLNQIFPFTYLGYDVSPIMANMYNQFDLYCFRRRKQDFSFPLIEPSLQQMRIQTNDTERFLRALEFLYQILSNIYDHPNMTRLRSIDPQHSKFRRQFGELPGAFQVLQAVGFVQVYNDADSQSFVWTNDKTPNDLIMAQSLVQSAIRKTTFQWQEEQNMLKQQPEHQQQESTDNPDPSPPAKILDSIQPISSSQPIDHDQNHFDRPDATDGLYEDDSKLPATNDSLNDSRMQWEDEQDFDTSPRDSYMRNTYVHAASQEIKEDGNPHNSESVPEHDPFNSYPNKKIVVVNPQKHVYLEPRLHDAKVLARSDGTRGTNGQDFTPVYAEARSPDQQPWMEDRNGGLPYDNQNQSHSHYSPILLDYPGEQVDEASSLNRHSVDGCPRGGIEKEGSVIKAKGFRKFRSGLLEDRRQGREHRNFKDRGVRDHDQYQPHLSPSWKSPELDNTQKSVYEDAALRWAGADATLRDSWDSESNFYGSKPSPELRPQDQCHSSWDVKRGDKGACNHDRSQGHSNSPTDVHTLDRDEESRLPGANVTLRGAALNSKTNSNVQDPRYWWEGLDG